MSANFHTPYNDPMDIDTPTLESPLAELDQAITNVIAGADSIDQLSLGSFSSKTISSGSITGDASLITVDTESSASSDDLDTISGASNGDVVFIKIANAGRVVTIRHNGGGTGNIRTWDGLNIRMATVNQLAALIYNGSNWVALPFNPQQLSFSIVSGVAISSGAITYTGSYMAIDTESSAATDDLDTISGGVQGAVLIIKSTNAGRVITIKHNTGNIKTSNNSDIVLNNTEKFVLLTYNAGSATWHTNYAPTDFQSVQGNTTTNANSNIFSVPYQGVVTSGYPNASATQPFMNLLPGTGFRQVRTLQAADTTVEGGGFGTLSVSGTGSNNYGTGSGSATPGSFVRWQSAGSSGSFGGVISPFTLTSINCYPTFRIIFRTYTSVSVCRFWIGLSSAALGNTDSPSSAATSFMGVRYSTVVPDSFWQFVTSDGTTTTASSTGVTIATDNTYELLISAAETSITMYFRNIANATYVSLTTATTLPGSNIPLGLNARVETREAVAKSLQMYSTLLYH